MKDKTYRYSLGTKISAAEDEPTNDYSIIVKYFL